MHLKTIIIILYILCCQESDNNTLKPGVYYGSTYSLSEKIVLFFEGKRKLSIGRQLTINNDNSFEYKNCKDIFSGYLRTKKDTLFLFSSDKTYKFLIDGNQLIRLDYLNTDTYERLISINSEKK